MDSSVSTLFRDLMMSLRGWRAWLLMGYNDVATQYRRSFLGPWWIPLTTGVFIFAFGSIGASIFGFTAETFIPWFAVGKIVFDLISAFIVEGSLVFITAAGYIRQGGGPKLIFVFQFLTKSVIIFFHNFIIVLMVLFYFDLYKNVAWSYLAVGFLAIIFCAFPLISILGAISLRFRDITTFLGAVLPVIFFMTPIVWMPKSLSKDLLWVVEWNPLASFVDLLRLPLLGDPQFWGLFWQCFFIGVVFWVGFILFFRFARPRLVYWL